MKAILLVSLLLSGCGYHIDGWQVSVSDKLCSKHGGLDYIDGFGFKHAVCNDGAEYLIDVEAFKLKQKGL